MSRHKFRPQVKTITVDVEVEVSYREIIEQLLENEQIDHLLEEAGFIRREDVGMEEAGTILDSMKLELVLDIMKVATLDQLERFRKTL